MPVEIAGLRRALHHRRPRAAQGRDLAATRISRDTLERSPRGPRRLLQGRDRRAPSPTYMQAQRRLPQPTRTSRRTAREWVEPVSTNYRGVRCLGAAAQRAGDRRAADPEHPRGLRPRRDGLRQSPTTCTSSSRPRSSPSRIARASTPILEFDEIPVERADLQGVRGAAPRAHRSASAPRGSYRGRATPRCEDGDTIYLTAADADGNMVSLIQSNYRGMGCGHVPARAGLHPPGSRRALRPRGGPLNSYAPGKRPFHTIIPAFITKDGKPWISFGVMGGGMQPQGHAQIVMNLVDFGMNLQEAGDAPRIHHCGRSRAHRASA